MSVSTTSALTFTRRRMMVSAFTMLIGLTTVSAGTVTAADPLDLIPGDVSAVVRLQAPQTTIQDLAAFADEVQPGVGALVQMQAGTLGAAISNPTLAGVDQSQDWYFAIDARPAAEPAVLMLIPATDVDELQEAVGSSFQFVEADGWVACSTSEELIEQVRRLQDSSADAIAAQLDSRHTELMRSGHLGLFVSVTDLRSTYAKQLATADDQLNQVIDLMADQIASASPGMDVDYVWTTYRDMGAALLQAVRDSEELVVTISVKDQALQIEELLSVEKESSTAALFGSQPSGDIDLLTALPEDQTAYMAMQGDPRPLMNWVRKLMSGMLKDEAASERFDAALEVLSKATDGTVVTCGSILPDSEPSLRYYAISRSDPASTIRDTVEAFGDELEYDFSGIHQRLTLQRDVEQIDGHSLHLYRVEQDVGPELDPFGIQKQLNERLYGPDGINQFLVFREDTTLQALGDGSDAMKLLLRTSAWSDEQLLSARQRLPEQACLIVLVDIPEFVISMGRVMVDIGALPIPVDSETLAGLKLPRSYAGFSVSLQPDQLHARTVIPLKTFQGFARMAAFAQQASQGAPATP